MACTFVDTIDKLQVLVASLSDLPTTPPSLYVDLEGNNLCRHGTIAILQIFVPPPRNHTYLIDICKLQRDAFDWSVDQEGTSLKSILESPDIPKIFFDVRNDSDALYNLYGIRLAGVQDLQLMELITRTFNKAYVNGLKKCIEKDANMSYNEKQTWLTTKDKGTRLFDPAKGGNYAIFEQRPLPEVMQMYCIQDVVHMPAMYASYGNRMGREQWDSVSVATQTRIDESQSPGYVAKGPHKALAPWPGWPRKT